MYVVTPSPSITTIDQEELQSLVNLTLLLYNNLSSAQWKNNSNVGLAYNVGVDVTTDDPSDSFYASGVFSLRFVFAEGLYALFICAYPMQEKSYHDALWLDTWRKFAGHVTRLQHLDTLKFEFEYLFELEHFVMTMRPILRSIRRAGKAMAFDVYGEREWTSWEFETSVEFRRRFFYAHEAAPGKATTTAEDDAAEKFNMMISFSADDRDPGIAFPIYWKDPLE